MVEIDLNFLCSNVVCPVDSDALVVEGILTSATESGVKNNA